MSAESQRPPDEIWWERELHRNEKIIDKYMEVLGDEPDWDKWKKPEDLYNKVHYGIDPPEDPKEPEDSTDPADVKFEPFLEHLGLQPGELADDPTLISAINEACEALSRDTSEDETDYEQPEQGGDRIEEVENDPLENDPPDNEDYPEIAKQARQFAGQVFRAENLPELDDVFFLSAGKVGANLAGGHGLGYEDHALCGNIVKCRWALADCEFCREMLEQHLKRTSRYEYAELLEQCRALSAVIKDRIARLRARAWWQSDGK